MEAENYCGFLYAGIGTRPLVGITQHLALCPECDSELNEIFQAYQNGLGSDIDTEFRNFKDVSPGITDRSEFLATWHLVVAKKFEHNEFHLERMIDRLRSRDCLNAVHLLLASQCRLLALIVTGAHCACSPAELTAVLRARYQRLQDLLGKEEFFQLFDAREGENCFETMVNGWHKLLSRK